MGERGAVDSCRIPTGPPATHPDPRAAPAGPDGARTRPAATRAAAVAVADPGNAVAIGPCRLH